MIGQTLAAVQAEVFHLGDDAYRETPLAVSLIFEDETRLTLECAEEGETLVFSDREPEPSEMEEAGCVEVEDMADDDLWREAIGQKLFGAAEVVNGEGAAVGLGLHFERRAVVIVNIDEELYVLSDLPAELDLKWGDAIG